MSCLPTCILHLISHASYLFIFISYLMCYVVRSVHNQHLVSRTYMLHLIPQTVSFIVCLTSHISCVMSDYLPPPTLALQHCTFQSYKVMALESGLRYGRRHSLASSQVPLPIATCPSLPLTPCSPIGRAISMRGGGRRGCGRRGISLCCFCFWLWGGRRRGEGCLPKF